MGPQFVFFVRTMVASRIDGPNGGCLFVAKTNVHAFIRRVIPQIIDISVKVDGGEEVVGRPVIVVELALAAGHKQLVHFGSENHSLRIRHSRDRALQRSPADIDHLDRVVAQRGDKQFSSTGSEVIETSLDTFQRNRFGQDKRPSFLRRGTLLRMGLGRQHEQQRQRYAKITEPFHAILQANQSPNQNSFVLAYSKCRSSSGTNQMKFS
jgi:hypothetical protein